jgi:N-methylhydantoinase A/oxoprolinase/acetone carboxylase beta subunit
MMHIHTVAAGGGSILSFDGSRLKVGPESAGADPGPACYRRGGPPIDDGGSGIEGGGGGSSSSSSSGRVGLAVSDINVMLGKLRPEFFPPVFGPGMDQPLDVEIVAQRFEAAAAKINAAFPLLKPKSAHEVAAGFLAIAVDHMAIAIKEITTRRGIDVSKYTLCSFGGAGGQHACLVADALGMPTCFLHPFAGVLSAYGMGLADVRTFEEAVMEVKLPPRKEKEEEEEARAAAAGGDSASSSDGVGGGGESDVRVVAGFGYGAADEEDQGVADSAAVAAATEADDAFATTFHMLATKAVEGVRAQLTKDKDGSGGGGGDDCIEVSYRAQVRYQGTDSTILCDWPAVSIRQEEKESGGGGGMAAAAPVAQRSGEACESVALDFEARHRQQFGFVMGRDKPLVVQSVSVEAWAPTADPATIDKELSPPPEGHQGGGRDSWCIKCVWIPFAAFPFCLLKA